MKTAIVTGSYGYIGSVLCRLLKEKGYYVIGIDNDKRAIDDWMKNGARTSYCEEYMFDDFSSDKALHLVRQYPSATVFHLAASSLLGPSAYDPLSYYQNNTSKTIELVKELKSSHKLIFASTAAVYAETDKDVKETSKIDPPNNYGRSKLWCEQVIDAAHRVHDLQAVSFRFFNVIGAYGDVGQLPETPHIVNQLCDRSMKKDKPFTVNGTDYATKDGTCVRDYLHVVDIARAMIHADEYLELDSEACHHKFNLGTKSGTTVKEIVEAFRANCDEVEVAFGERRVGDPRHLVADPTKFMKQTGFKYQYSDDLNKMICSAWEYRNA